MVNKIVLALLLAFTLCLPIAAEAKRGNIIGVDDPVRLFTAKAVAASGSETTASYGELALSEVQSIAWRAVGTSPNYKVEVLCSLDGVNYVVPEIGGLVWTGADTTGTWHITALSIPTCRAIKIRVTELGAANSLAADVLIVAQ